MWCVCDVWVCVWYMCCVCCVGGVHVWCVYVLCVYVVYILCVCACGVCVVWDTCVYAVYVHMGYVLCVECVCVYVCVWCMRSGTCQSQQWEEESLGGGQE